MLVYRETNKKNWTEPSTTDRKNRRMIKKKNREKSRMDRTRCLRAGECVGKLSCVHTKRWDEAKERTRQSKRENMQFKNHPIETSNAGPKLPSLTCTYKLDITILHKTQFYPAACSLKKTRDPERARAEAGCHSVAPCMPNSRPNWWKHRLDGSTWTETTKIASKIRAASAISI